MNDESINQQKKHYPKNLKNKTGVILMTQKHPCVIQVEKTLRLEDPMILI